MSILYNTVKDSILKNKELKEQGKYIGIPMPFKRLAEYIPSIEKGYSIGLLGATGSGKSRLTRYLFLYEPYKFYKLTGYPIRIFLFALEDNKEKVYRNLICHYLFDLYGIYVSLQELDSKANRTLPDWITEKLEEAKEFFAEFEKVVTIVDGIHQPTEIFTYLSDYAKRTGTIEEVPVEVEGKIIKQARYIANNDVHTIVIVDNMSNIDPEPGAEDERKAMIFFCKKLVRERLCNFYRFTVVQVLQQDFQTERQSFTRDGSTIISKLEPSLASIGEAKTISRSMHLILGLFNPSRFDIIQYPAPTKRNPKTYRVDLLGNRFRSLSVLKCNDADFGQRVAFDFNAVNEVMKELPKIGDPALDKIYEKIREKQPGTFAKSTGVVLQEEDEDDTPF